MKHNCSPRESALKSYFLAPRAENKDLFFNMTQLIFNDWISWREKKFSNDGNLIPDSEKKHHFYKKNIQEMTFEVQAISKMFSNEISRHSPHYIGHMYSEFSLPALLGHMLALLYNPNNISSESSTVGVQLEREAIEELVKMIDYPKTARGHFTSGGTIANFEMLYRARKIFEKSKLKSKELPVLLIPESAHYSWIKGADLIGLKKNQILRIKLNKTGSVDFSFLKKNVLYLIKNNIPILGIISVFGSTELGTIDPIDKISIFLKSIKKEYKIFIWHHIDAAYGAYFAALKKSLSTSSTFYKNIMALQHSDSITIDPHKLGYVPYSSGCFLCREARLYTSVNTSAPYVDFSSQLEPGPYTLEGSRSAAGALATLLSAKTMKLNNFGLGQIINRSIKSAECMRKKLKKIDNVILIEPIPTNIVCFFIKSNSKGLRQNNLMTKKLFEKINLIKENNEVSFFVSKTILNKAHQCMIKNVCVKNNILMNTDELFLIRCTIMNPFINSRYSHVEILSIFCKHIKFLSKSLA